MFQSTPRFITAANIERCDYYHETSTVSIHAAIHHRGEHRQPSNHRHPCTVSIHAAIHHRGERTGNRAKHTRIIVSIHAAIHHRGEHFAEDLYNRTGQFQSTPRFITAANAADFS